MKLPSWFNRSVLLSLILGSTNAMAGIQVSGTRVIYPGELRHVTVHLTNKDAQPRLVKVWVDDAPDTGAPSGKDVPFLVTPPLSRVEPGDGQALRLARVLPITTTDRESVYWLNVLDIPPSAKGNGTNSLQFAVRTRLKIFYRPPGLTGSQADAAAGLTWRTVQEQGKTFLECNNDSLFHVSLADIDVDGEPKKLRGEMVAPKSSQRFELVGKASAVHGTAHSISDHGALIAQPFQAIATP